MKFPNRQIRPFPHEPLPAQHDGLGRALKLFSGQLPKLPALRSLGVAGLTELNEVLAA